MKHCCHGSSHWMTSCHWWQVLWNGPLISMKFLLQVAFKENTVTVLKLKTFQFRNKEQNCNPDFYLFSLFAKSVCQMLWEDCFSFKDCIIAMNSTLSHFAIINCSFMLQWPYFFSPPPPPPPCFANVSVAYKIMREYAPSQCKCILDCSWDWDINILVWVSRLVHYVHTYDIVVVNFIHWCAPQECSSTI